MTKGTKEELAEIVASCLEALSELSSFEKSLATEYEGIERTLRHLEERRGNEPITAEVGQAMVLHIRKALEGNRLNAEGVHIVTLLLLKVSLLAQLGSGMNIETLEEARGEFEAWSEQWKAAKEAWDRYTA
jgi:hypothetical protein